MSENFTEQLKDEVDALWRFAVRLCNDHSIAEDLVQKTILRSLEKQHQYIPGTRLISWLFKILHSIWKNDLRDQAIRNKVSFNVVELDEVESKSASSEDSLFFKQVIQHLNTLPEAQRTVMMLVCVDGYSYKETANIIGIPEGTVMSRIARARLKIGQTFNQDVYSNAAKRQKNAFASVSEVK